jgi:hypothetical protein
VKKHRLAIVSAEETLEGKATLPFERLARSCSPGDSDHRGVMAIALGLTHRCVKSTVPPSAVGDLLKGTTTVQLWLKGQATSSSAKAARASIFQAAKVIENVTRRAVSEATEKLRSPTSSPLDQHADHVVERYAGLGAHFTVAAVCHLLDAVDDPQIAQQVLQDIEGARAYQSVGLGAARHPAFRKAAWDQASWESSRLGGGNDGNAAQTSLALQVFHEYLGGRYRAHADAERIFVDSFVTWALSGRADQSSAF